ARDTFLGLLKTCQKLRVSFFDYLGNRLGVDGAPNITNLPDLVHAIKLNRPDSCPDYVASF
ncbi:MAG: hypothetical protein AAGA73_14230, partial [Pseudomonadota bacterium]